MSTTKDPRQLRDLLGAYALGAVNADEREQLEGLLASDDGARAELRGYERATALLRSEDGPSEAVWSRIEQAMLAEPATPSPPASLSQHRWRRRAMRVGVSVAAAAALIALAVWSDSHLTSQSPPIQPTSNIRHAAERVAAQPGSRRLELISGDGKTRLDVLVAADGRAFLLGGKLAGPRPGDTLALFATTTSRTVLVQAVGPTLRAVEFHLPGGTISLVLGETAGPGRPVTVLAQSPVSGACSGPCPGTGSGATPLTPSPVTPIPLPRQPGPAASGSPVPGTAGSGNGNGGVLPPITLAPLPALPRL